jgi:hypothetical protein
MHSNDYQLGRFEEPLVSHNHSQFRTVTYLVVALCLALTGCSRQMEPAKKAIADIQAAVTAAGPDAEKYIPDQVKAVNDQLADLRTKFDQKDYAAVVAAAPALLTKAQGLAAAKDAAMKEEQAKEAAAQAAAEQALQDDWASLSSAIPSSITAIDDRLNTLKKARKLPANITKDALTTAESDLTDAKSLWQQATDNQSANNLHDAVASAKQAKEKLDAAMSGLAMSS